MSLIGPTFEEELRVAITNLDGISWGADGVIEFRDDVSQAIRDKVLDVYRLHIPINIKYVKRLKSDEIIAACKTANTQGFLSTALDGVNQYRYSTDNVFGDSSNENIDMLFLSAAYSKAVNNISTPAWTIQYPCKGPSDTDYKLYAHTASQMITVGDAGFAFIQANRIKLRTKLGQIKLATTIEEVQAITW